LKLPRDLSGEELAKRLGRFGYTITRQTGSHIRLTSNFKGSDHHVTIPAHDPLKIGTLNSILHEVAIYLEMDKQDLAGKLELIW
jgi:predicted RNA binding protein YcfA (HicA-like mRNA interferase family)